MAEKLSFKNIGLDHHFCVRFASSLHRFQDKEQELYEEEQPIDGEVGFKTPRPECLSMPYTISSLLFQFTLYVKQQSNS